MMISLRHTTSRNSTENNLMTTNNTEKYNNSNQTVVTSALSSPSSSTTDLVNITGLSIPKLDQILDDDFNQGANENNYFNKVNFIDFLVKKHCLENFEFYLELKNFIRYNPTCLHDWNGIFKDYIELNSLREINLPGDMKCNMSLNIIPELDILKSFLKICKDYLHASYQEFTNEVLMNVAVESEGTSTYSSERQDDEYTTSSSSVKDRCVSPLSIEAHTNINVDTSSTSNSATASSIAQSARSYQKSSNQSSVSSASQVNTNNALPASQINTNNTLSPSRRNYSISSAISDSSSPVTSPNNGNNSSTWNKIGKKFKWRRASNTSSNASCD